MVYIEERTYFPDGMDPAHDDAPAFAVGVYYRGNDLWAVATSPECNRQLSWTGQWLWMPQKATALTYCRFPFKEACRLAEQAVNTRKVNGRTWAEWCLDVKQGENHAHTE